MEIHTAFTWRILSYLVLQSNPLQHGLYVSIVKHFGKLGLGFLEIPVVLLKMESQTFKMYYEFLLFTPQLQAKSVHRQCALCSSNCYIYTSAEIVPNQTNVMLDVFLFKLYLQYFRIRTSCLQSDLSSYLNSISMSPKPEKRTYGH